MKTDKSKRKTRTFSISFQTDLNASMRVEIPARTWESAIKKLLKDYPSAFDIDGQ